MKKILLLNPQAGELYAKAKVRAAIGEGYAPSLTLATLAAPLVRNPDFMVEVLDLNMSESPHDDLVRSMERFSPEFVGITFSTPLFNRMVELCDIVKLFDKNIFIIGGGPHASALPEECLRDSVLDAVVVGEGDFAFADIVSGKRLSSLKGVWWRRDDNKISRTEGRGYVENLDVLKYPAWGLFDIGKYRASPLLSKKNPVGLIETSRGCIFGCDYCNKTVFGRSFRAKSPERVIDELSYMLDAGFKEVHIADDGFTTDIARAKKICDLIKERRLQFPWNINRGIRVDRLDEEFLKKAHDCGCYLIAIGVESGDQSILDGINKGITLEQVKRAVKLIKAVGIEVVAYFMLALPGDTKETMQKTIDFAKELDPDVVKVSITLPLPGTPLYDKLDKGGFLKSKDWSLYNQDDPKLVYNHPNLEWETVYEYYDKFYREFYVRGSYILNRIKKSAVRGNLLNDLSAFLKTKW